MAITDYKITTGEVNSNHVKNAPNVLTGTAQTNKNYFDKLPELIVSKHNNLIDAIGTDKQDKLVSGTNIKTVNSTSLLGSGNVAVQPTLVSGTNIKTVNSTSLLGSGNISVQPTLVSGTNIKTINNNSILGSGNVALQPTLVSGTNIKTINNNSILGSGNLTVDYSDYTYATDSANGVHGLVPAPLKPTSPVDNSQVLTARFGWQTVTMNSTFTNTGNISVNLRMRDNGSSTDHVVRSVTLPNATTTSSGTMSAADKTKLDNLTTEYDYTLSSGNTVYVGQSLYRLFTVADSSAITIDDFLKIKAYGLVTSDDETRFYALHPCECYPLYSGIVIGFFNSSYSSVAMDMVCHVLAPFEITGDSSLM